LGGVKTSTFYLLFLLLLLVSCGKRSEHSFSLFYLSLFQRAHRSESLTITLSLSTIVTVAQQPKQKSAPGVAFAFKGAYQTEINVGEGENGEAALRRFRKQVMNSGHINEVRRRRYFENKQDILKRKQSTPRKLKGPKPRTMAQALADKEAGREEGQRPQRRFNRPGDEKQQQ
jgi:ribosomal protein S21